MKTLWRFRRGLLREEIKRTVKRRLGGAFDVAVLAFYETTSSRVRRTSCWTCGEEGHVMRNCDRQGNGDGKAGAPEVFPQKH